MFWNDAVIRWLLYKVPLLYKDTVGPHNCFSRCLAIGYRSCPVHVQYVTLGTVGRTDVQLMADHCECEEGQTRGICRTLLLKCYRRLCRPSIECAHSEGGSVCGTDGYLSLLTECECVILTRLLTKGHNVVYVPQA